MKNKLQEIWAKQELESSREVVREKIEDINEVNCFIGLIGSTGARMFQLEVQADIKINSHYLNKFKGIEIQNIAVSSSNLQKFTIILLDGKLKDIFLLFIVDLLKRLKIVQNTQEALIVINQRVSYWKQLFAHASGEILNPVLQRGLYGELVFLKQLLEQNECQENILNSWKGADSANQDFAFNKTAVEIKTSKAGIPNIYISNEHQLDYTVWENLYLGVISINESAGQENTLSSLIQEIMNILENDLNLITLFEEKLILVGIPKDMFAKYNEINYLIRGKFFFKIGKHFPFIIPLILHNEGVFNVKYQIDINSCKPFEVKEEEVLKIYHGQNNYN